MMFMVDVAMVKLPWVVRGIGHQSENFLRFPVWDGWPESICSVWKTNEHGTIICRYIIYHINPHNTVRQQSYRPLLAICQRKNGIYGMIIPVRTIRITGRGRSLYTAQFLLFEKTQSHGRRNKKWSLLRCCIRDALHILQFKPRKQLFIRLPMGWSFRTWEYWPVTGIEWAITCHSYCHRKKCKTKCHGFLPLSTVSSVSMSEVSLLQVLTSTFTTWESADSVKINHIRFPVRSN